MNQLRDTFYEGERPLFAAQDLLMENVKFYPGESALKQSSGVTASNCNFMGKYPFWHSENIEINHSNFTIYSRAAIWYSQNIRMTNTIVDAPKMFRKCSNLYIENTKFLNALECCWYCNGIEYKNVEVIDGDYIFMNSSNIRIDGLKLQGHYSFQDAKNVEIHHAHIDSRDAFWETENVTVYDSVLSGEFLGWHSKNLKLVNCTITGTQPLCYATDLVLENCMMIDTDFCFEYSTVHAQINGHLQSIRNPTGGAITANSIGEVIIDKYCVNSGDCKIISSEKAIYREAV